MSGRISALEGHRRRWRGIAFRLWDVILAAKAELSGGEIGSATLILDQSAEWLEPAGPLAIGDRVSVTDEGTVRKINVSSSGDAMALLVECDSSGDAAWMAPELLRKVAR